MTKLEQLKQQLAKMQETVNRMEAEIKSEFTYPMWFTTINSDVIVKFTSLNMGEVISGEDFPIGETRELAPHTEGQWTQIPEPIKYHYPMWFKNKYGQILKFTGLTQAKPVLISDKKVYSGACFSYEYYIPHTCIKIWAQVPEPIKQWEPQGGRWFVHTRGIVYEGDSDNNSKLFGAEYQTKEQAEWASKQMRSFNRLLCYVAEHTDELKDIIINTDDLYPEIVVFTTRELCIELDDKILSGEVVL